MKNLRFYTFALIVILYASCQKAAKPPLYNATKSAVADSAMVVSPHPLASDVGITVLQRGGNAVDAAVAVQFAMAACFPRAGNIGGGGFMLIRMNDGTLDALDYREKGPAAANRDMYLDSLGNVAEGLSTEGHLASGVPGTVAGLFAAHEKYGKLPMRELIQPAIDIAKNGYKLSQSEADRFNRFQDAFRKYNDETSPFVRDTFMESSDFVQLELARTLELIRDGGSAGFYEGETADDIVAEMQSGGGIITHDDLKNYQAAWRKPLVGEYKGYRVIAMPPASSGGVALLQLLELVEPYPLADWGFHSAEAVHTMVEAERRVYADRAAHMGDMDFYDVPIDSLLDPAYLEARMVNFSISQATASESIASGDFTMMKESFETTHTSIIDAEGNAVSVTTTLNSNFGSKVWVDGAGFFLNNEMDDFSAKPGVPNQFGLIGNEANAIHPGKRMLSSMTPTIVEKDGKVFLVLGAPGGSTIITAVFQVFMNVAEFNMNLEDAVNAGRFHHQWLPDEIMVERGALDATTIQTLENMGHTFREVNSMAVIKAIQRLPDGKLHGVGDQRNADDTARGY